MGNLKSWQAGVAVAIGLFGLIGLFGFVTPSSRAEKNEKGISEIKQDLVIKTAKDAEQDLHIAVMQRDLDFAARGIDALLRDRGITPRSRR